jgi:adhesin transport system outer membrane protein
MKFLSLTLCAAACALRGEVHTLTLKQVAGRAMTQSPDALLSRLDEQRAQSDAEAARDPYVPRFHVGSGLGKAFGFPMLGGSAPSIFEARGSASVYNRKQAFELKQAREAARGASIDGERRREEAVFAAVDLYLEAERKARMAELARRQIESARKLDEIVRARVTEGRELAVEAKRSALEVAKAEQRVEAMEAERDYAEGSLALVLGFPAGDRVHAAAEERGPAAIPENEAEAVRQAAADNKEIRRLESALSAKGLEAEAERSARYPQFDLVAQYAMLGRFNNYEDFFRKFQRHNGQIGMSMQIPLWLSPAAKAMAAKADSEGAKLRIELQQTRGRIALETERRYRDFRTADTARHVARLDLEVAREQLSVQLARMEEGRATLKDVEELRVAEQEKWIAYFNSQAILERARYALLERTGGLLAALR